MRPMGIKHADRYLVVTLEEVVQVVPLTDRAACMVQSMPAALLEVVLTPAHLQSNSRIAVSETSLPATGFSGLCQAAAQ